uniref:GAPA225 n=1 Tax=Homo sapiens TaxID=9606 RepID=UPI0000696448|nr:Chain A, GAPA225 [Homo sapiens]1Z9M_B Chain B, GAPA225 [Homo sapiens]
GSGMKETAAAKFERQHMDSPDLGTDDDDKAMADINLSQDDSQPWTSDETVVAGGTVVLKCQVKDHEDSSLQWSNPAQQTLYFGEKRALRDNRIQLVTSTPHELSISISNVALADEGEYTCSIFTMPVRTAKSLVTVLGIPQKPII